MEEEFINLINKNLGILHKVSNAYFNNDPFIDDYRQEILIRLWKAYPGFKGKSKFSTWMYRVSINAAIDIVRKIRLLPSSMALSKDELELPEKINNEHSDKLAMLYELIARLNDAEKALVLLYLDGYTYEEIAETVGLTKTNVGVKLNRLKKQMSEKIKSNERA